MIGSLQNFVDVYGKSGFGYFQSGGGGLFKDQSVVTSLSDVVGEGAPDRKGFSFFEFGLDVEFEIVEDLGAWELG